MHINGWQRLWLLGAIVWAVVILALAGIFQSGGDQGVPSANMVPVRGAAFDRASRGGLCVRPWPRLGPSWISSRVKVAHYRLPNHMGKGELEHGTT